MSTTPDSSPLEYRWEPQPRAQALVRHALAEAKERAPEIAALEERLLRETATRLIDWLDFIELPEGSARAAELEDVGFVRREEAGRAAGVALYDHPGGLFPMVAVSPRGELRVGVKADEVVDALVAAGPGAEAAGRIEGAPLAALRRAPLIEGEGVSLWAVERHGTRAFDPAEASGCAPDAVLRHLEAFRLRERRAESDEQAWAALERLVDAAVSELGRDRAADTFFIAEREYWQRRNRAARVQKARQDTLGLGWANHDHHTYRSSRAGFARLIAVLEKLGFHCRERFYAGAEAGWGAQVLEQPACGVVIFADVDLAPGEIEGDFSHEGLPSSEQLGTVGLWVGLHGESMLEAGLHHLECMFDHAALCDQLKAAGIETMPPFTTFPFLRQAFTEGERWTVREERLERLVAAGRITSDQANEFRLHGAIGSHLENLQREDGYKGFNQQGVSDIIGRTDPRRHSSNTRGV